MDIGVPCPLSTAHSHPARLHAGVPPLVLLTRGNNAQLKMARGLLEAGADVNAANTQPTDYPPGTSFLHIHARYSDLEYVEVIKDTGSTLGALSSSLVS